MRVLYAVLPALLLAGCIRPQNYHQGKPSTFFYQFRSNDPNYAGKKGQAPGYFEDAKAYEAFVEFDARGSMYRDEHNHTVQLDASGSNPWACGRN